MRIVLFQLTLGLIGGVMGALAVVGVALNNNNVNNLSKDQDSICTTVGYIYIYIYLYNYKHYLIKIYYIAKSNF